MSEHPAGDSFLPGLKFDGFFSISECVVGSQAPGFMFGRMGRATGVMGCKARFQIVGGASVVAGWLRHRLNLVDVVHGRGSLLARSSVALRALADSLRQRNGLPAIALAKAGGPYRTRICDLFDVNEAL